MTNNLDAYGVTPEEFAAAYEEAALGSGLDPVSAKLAGLSAAMVQAQTEHQSFLLFPDKGEPPVAI